MHKQVEDPTPKYVALLRLAGEHFDVLHVCAIFIIKHV
jgi:hypothetical protein